MEYITAVSNEFYNPEYFNIQEQMEYQIIQSEYIGLVESYLELAMEDVDGATYDPKAPGKIRKTASGIYNKVMGDKSKGLTRGQAFLQKINDFFRIVKETLTKLIRKFMDKVDELFKLNNKFITERARQVTEINDDDFWEKTKVTLYPYQNQVIYKDIYTEFGIPKIDDGGNRLTTILTFKGNEKEFREKWFKKITDRIGDGESFKDGCKNYYRGISRSDEKMRVLEGGPAKTACRDAYAFLKGYKDITARNIRDSLSDFNGAFERVGRDFKTNHIDKYTSEAYEPMYEQDEQGGTNGGVDTSGMKASTQTDPKTGAPHTGSEAFNRIKLYGNILYTIHTARMTIAEEYYFAALHVLKAVYSAGVKYGKITTKEADRANKANKADEAGDKAKKDSFNELNKNGAKQAEYAKMTP